MKTLGFKIFLINSQLTYMRFQNPSIYIGIESLAAEQKMCKAELYR